VTRYAFFSISFRSDQTRAADASIEEWMYQRAAEGYEFIEHRQGIAFDGSRQNTIIAVTIVMRK